MQNPEQFQITETRITPQIYDLHSHTTASDGVLAPEQLVERAATMHVTHLAITDHDTVLGVHRAQLFLRENSLPITLIPGVEISTRWHAHDIHIVGLWIDIENDQLVNLLKDQQIKRAARAELIADKLAKSGIADPLNGARKHAQLSDQLSDQLLTRTHFAHYLVELGIAKTVPKVFKKYLAKGKLGYVRADWCEMQTAIETIHAAGGKAVLAHPFSYDLKGKWLRKLFEEFAEMGGDAAEVANSQLPPDRRKLMAELVIANNLRASQGSDFHMPCAWYELGRNLWLPAGVKGIWEPA